MDVRFASGSIELTLQAKVQLAEFAATYRHAPLIDVMGRDDAPYATVKSALLAHRRAEVIKRELERLGVDPVALRSTFRAAGAWYDGRNDTPDERAANRRVIVQAHQASEPEPVGDHADTGHLVARLIR